MPISTYWYDDDHRAITQKFEGTWTWDELAHEMAKVVTLAASVPYDLVLFTDMEETNLIPKGNVLAQGKSSIAGVPENVSHLIIVMQSRLIEVFAGIVFDMIPKWRNHVQFVKTVEEGKKLLEEVLAVNATRSGAG